METHQVGEHTEFSRSLVALYTCFGWRENELYVVRYYLRLHCVSSAASLVAIGFARQIYKEGPQMDQLQLTSAISRKLNGWEPTVQAIFYSLWTWNFNLTFPAT